MTIEARECLEKFKGMPKVLAKALFLAQKEQVVNEIGDYFNTYNYDEFIDKLISNTYTYTEMQKVGSFSKFCQNEFGYTPKTTLWFELTVLEKYEVQYVRKLIKHFLKDNYSDLGLLYELNLTLRCKWQYYQDLKNDKLTKFYFDAYDNINTWELRKFTKEVYIERLAV